MANGVGFLKIEGIEGESQDAGHSKWIDILAWSWGMDNPTNPHLGSGSGASFGHVHNFSITKQVDKSSAKLAQFLLKGKQFSKATFEIVKVIGEKKPETYYKIEFEQVMVSSMSFGGSGGDGVFTENISFSFVKFKITYHEQQASGKLVKVDTLGWDCAKNEEL